MTDKVLCVGRFYSVIGIIVGFKLENDLGMLGKRPQRERRPKYVKAFAENKRISECFEEASLQALTSQL